jgi:xanthine dehydrogenase accessory factor
VGMMKLLAEAEERGEAVALCTVVESSGSAPRHAGSKMLVFPDRRIVGSVGGGEIENRSIQAAVETLEDGKPRLLTISLMDPEQGDAGVCGGQVKVFVEPVVERPLLLVVGGGHVGKAVAHLAAWLGWRVAVSDDRPEFCTPEANPDAHLFHVGPMAEIPQKFKITLRTVIVVVTRGSEVDVQGLPVLLDTPAGYIGVIGSRRRWAMTRQTLLEAGAAEEKLNRVHSPIGLEIHAETPEEIAVSIMAEVLSVKNGGTGKSMSMNAPGAHATPSGA